MGTGTELNPWLARISKNASDEKGVVVRGKTVGTGFITVFPWLVTCNHVLTDCLNGKSSKDEIESVIYKEIVVDFPFNQELKGKLFVVSVVVSVPSLDQTGDVAVLKLHDLDGNHEASFNQLAIPPYERGAFPEKYTGQDIWSKGFHVSGGDGLNGKTTTNQTNDRIVIELDNIHESIKGASGAPVWGRGEKKIIGMLVSQRGKNAPTLAYQRVYMIPMYKILEVCSEHKKILLQKRVEVNQGVPRDKEKDSVVSVFLQTIDRYGQLSIIEQCEKNNRRCFFFECVASDNPAYLAHHLKIKPYLDKNIYPSGNDQEIQATVLGNISRKGVFESKLVSELDFVEKDFSGSNIFYVPVESLKMIKEVVVDVQFVLSGLDSRYDGINIVVLVACYERSNGFFNKLRDWSFHKKGIVVLPPLESLNYSALCLWLDSLPKFFSKNINVKELKRDFRKILSCDEDQEKYCDIEVQVEKSLLQWYRN